MIRVLGRLLTTRHQEFSHAADGVGEGADVVGETLDTFGTSGDGKAGFRRTRYGTDYCQNRVVPHQPEGPRA
jgi:hypothetical protein